MTKEIEPNLAPGNLMLQFPFMLATRYAAPNNGGSQS
jgi:hypothetical protein